MRSRRHDAGFALAGLICIITAAAVATAVVIPLRVMQSRRQTEQELIFRGQEYIRAIQKYQYKYGIYPSSIDDLISRDGYRFLRRQYKDPINGEDFRLINVNADGSLTGSLTLLSLPVSAQANAAPGTMPNANMGGTSPQQGASSGNGQGGNSRAGVQNSANTSGVGSAAGAGASMGFASNGGISGISNPFGGGGTTNNSNRAGVNGGGVGTGAGTGGAFGGGSIGTVTPGTLGGATNTFGAMTNPLGGGGTTQQNNNTGNRPAGTGGGATGTAGGAPTAGAPSAIPTTGFGAGGAAAQISPGVAGVASESTKTAVMIYNEKEKYNEWEFIAPRIQAAQQQGADGAQQGGNRAQQGNNQGNRVPQANLPFGQNSLGGGTNPLGTGTNPFGGGNSLGTGTNPLGGGGTNTGGPAGRR